MTELQFNLFKTLRFLIYDLESNDIGWTILLDIIPFLPDNICALIINDLNSGLLDDLYRVNEKEYKDLDKYIEAFNKLLLEFKPKSYKERKLLAIKAKKKAQLGDRAKSLSFKRNYKFDSKLKRFVKRKKPLDLKTLKKKAKLMKKLHKKASFKNKLKKAKEYYKHHKISV